MWKPTGFMEKKYEKILGFVGLSAQNKTNIVTGPGNLVAIFFKLEIFACCVMHVYQ
jgi:hypothetical protein